MVPSQSDREESGIGRDEIIIIISVNFGKDYVAFRIVIAAMITKSDFCQTLQLTLERMFPYLKQS